MIDRRIGSMKIWSRASSSPSPGHSRCQKPNLQQLELGHAQTRKGRPAQPQPQPQVQISVGDHIDWGCIRIFTLQSVALHLKFMQGALFFLAGGVPAWQCSFLELAVYEYVCGGIIGGKRTGMISHRNRMMDGCHTACFPSMDIFEGQTECVFMVHP
jgi:hypothetical protein